MKRKSYKAKDLYVGILSMQGKTQLTGGFLNGGHSYTLSNFDVGIFVKKGDKYVRLTDGKSYSCSRFASECSVVINKNSLNCLVDLYPETVKPDGAIPAQLIKKLEETLYEQYVVQKNNYIETINSK